jgi:SAM-dependent methyltransferase
VKTLIFATARPWLLTETVAAWQEKEPGFSYDLLANRGLPELAPRKMWTFRAGSRLSPFGLGPKLLLALRGERYDRVIVPLSNELGIGYRQVMLVAKLIGAAAVEIFFRHSPSGDYDTRYGAGYWDTKQTTRHGRWYTDALLGKARVLPGARILDLGCGTGIFTGLMRESGFRAVGVDRSTVGLAIAGKDYGEGLWVSGDAVELPFRRESFDAVFCRACSLVPFDLEEIAGTLRDAWGPLLKPGGAFLLVTPAIDQSGAPRTVVGARHHHPEMLRRFFRSAGFRSADVYFTHDRALEKLGALALSTAVTRMTREIARVRPDYYVSVTIARR